MSFVFRPATRENTPLIVGLAGPTKSGKTMSALRMAAGMTTDVSRIAMLNAEGKRGEQYADWFERTYGKKYLNCNIDPPYKPERYTEALLEMKKLNPTVGIIDSASHMHDGPGGLLEYHDAELERLSKGDEAKRDRNNWTAWIKPKAAENKFIYTMLGMDCPIILCFRAKEKLKIVAGKQPIDLGWQPIAGDRITFETIFTLVLPPHSKGVPDLTLSEMRAPFDSMVPNDKPIDEALGKVLMDWSRGTGSGGLTGDDIKDLETACSDVGVKTSELLAWIVSRDASVKTLGDVPREKLTALHQWINNRRKTA